MSPGAPSSRTPVIPATTPHRLSPYLVCVTMTRSSCLVRVQRPYSSRRDGAGESRRGLVLPRGPERHPGGTIDPDGSSFHPLFWRHPERHGFCRYRGQVARSQRDALTQAGAGIAASRLVGHWRFRATPVPFPGGPCDKYTGIWPSMHPARASAGLRFSGSNTAGMLPLRRQGSGRDPTHRALGASSSS